MIATRAAASALAVWAGLLFAPAAQSAEPLRFIALGDQPYGQESRTGPAYRHLIGLINAQRLRFAIHVGDFKDGLTDCSDALYARQLAYFGSYASALIYTPGDNDWVDCQRQTADPIERLQALRRTFFGTPQSLGERPLPLQRQSALMPAHAAFSENQRWWHERVLFATFHTVGPSDNIDDAAAALRQEQRAREAANVAWIRDAFTLARERGARALVLATQADVVQRGPTRADPQQVAKAFARTFTEVLVPLAKVAPFPVLLIHGDSHRLITDRPFSDADGRRVDNLWRLQVPGESRMHAVRVTVNPSAPTPFAFEQIWNPMSPDPN